MEKKKVSVSLTSGYHSQSCGQVERANQEIGLSAKKIRIGPKNMALSQTIAHNTIYSFYAYHLFFSDKRNGVSAQNTLHGLKYVDA